MCNCGCKNVGVAPFRVDHVGSYLRPGELVEAREKFSRGGLSQEQLKEVEDRNIKQLIKKQYEAGLRGLTDGEFRRAYWHLDFFWGLGGLEHIQGEKGRICAWLSSSLSEICTWPRSSGCRRSSAVCCP